ncbi:hypothetical protein LTR15_005205 [Elasticomyces elasticus]|nr:hypothetical protein LTR15_005205 [Elasticomyces elasticus]
MDSDTPPVPASPSTWRWLLGFLIVGACWGLTTPFMRRAAIARDKAPQTVRPVTTNPNVPWLKRKALGIIYAVIDLLKNPAYAVPLLLNITGSVWFFLLIGQAGEWYADGKVITRDTWIGMALVLGGIALCVQSKT